MDSRFGHASYLIRRKLFKLFGEAFHIFDPKGQLVFFCELKGFRLKEDLRVYTDESKTTEVLTIQARRILDFSSAYDVTDATTGERLGTLKRKGMKSLFQDEWMIMDAQENERGRICEDNLAFALIRRFVMNLIPQHFTAEVDGQPVCTFAQNFNPFILKVTVTFLPASKGRLDPRLGLAAAILLSAIEGRQD